MCQLNPGLQASCLHYRPVLHTVLVSAILLFDPFPRLKLRSRLSGVEAVATELSPFSKRLAPRKPPPIRRLDSDASGLDAMRDYTFSAADACSDTQAWIRHLSASAKLEQGSCVDLTLLAVFHMVRQDTVSLLGRVRYVLGQISNGSMDKQKMQEQLEHWQAVLGRLLMELPALGESIGRFFAFPYAESGDENASPPRQLTEGVRSLVVEITSMMENCNRAQESLRAEMSLLESKRGIQEAESVARLTELAFLYIPMTFAAGLFSMQLQELADNPPPVYAFIIAAFVAVIFSYGLRLLQRSTMVNESLRRLEERIRTKQRVWTGKIPARTVAKWLMGELLPILWIAAIIAVIVGIIGAVAMAIAPLWTRGAMDVSFKGAMSGFALLVFVFPVVYVIAAPWIGFGFGRVWRDPTLRLEGESEEPANTNADDGAVDREAPRSASGLV